MKRALVAGLIAVLGLPGCTGSVKVEKLSLPDDGAINNPIEGVVHYPLAYFVEVSATNTLVSKDGKVLGRAVDRTCQPIRSEKLVLRGDLANPYRIYYKPGLLENNKFGVQLAQGVLTAVNTESQPDRGQTLTNLTGAAASIPPAFFPQAIAAGVACNQGTTFIELRPYKMPAN